MDSKIASLINNQINFELYSAYLYFEIENYYSEKNLDGFANWFYVQTQEELDHAHLLFQYLHNNDEKVYFEAIAKPDAALDTIISGIQSAYAHEKLVTERFNLIFEAAFEKKDFRTMQLLDWFIKEQGEEEKSTKDLLVKTELFGSDPKSLYLLNNELAARAYTPPSLVL